MRILHVLSQFEVTGAEIYAIALMEEQQNNGHKIYVTSDTFSRPHLYNYFTTNIGNRKYPNRLRVYKKLKKFVLEKQIDVIHAHSRAASWICHWVSLKTNIPLISTVHGMQHIHFSSKLFNIYGDQIIAICENIARQLREKLKVNTGICTIRNGLNFSEFPIDRMEKIKSEEYIITFMGRLTGPKGEFIIWFMKNVFPLFYEKFNNARLIIIGGIIVPDEFPDALNEINSRYGREIIQHLTFQKNLVPFILNSDLCIGSGRVAMEIMALNRPVMAVGESCYIGIIKNDNIENAIITNFGDCAEKEERKVEPVLNDLVRFYTHYRQNAGNYKWYREFVSANYNILTVNKEIEKIYQEKIAVRKSRVKNLNVLMYHKVIDTAGIKPMHQIHVTKNRFEAQLVLLLEKGYTPITFADLSGYYNNKTPLPEKPVILTFDDGYKNNYDFAFPLAKKYKIKFVVFCMGKKAERNFWDSEDKEFFSELLSPEEIKEMSDYGIEIGSHTINHKKLSSLTKNEITCELEDSKKYLESITGKPVISLAYPYGDVDEKVKIIAGQTGYEFGIATTTGPLNFFKDRFEIRRIPVFPDTDLIGFSKKISRIYPVYKEFKNKIKGRK
jgi:peptidoglycan/xylan/chitin deacetylase (PgdA/CDA1 family)